MSENTVRSIERGFKILEELALEKTGFGVTELSERLNLHKSTVHRLLNTLLSLGYVEKDQYNDRYRLGMKLLNLAGAILDRMDLRREARDELRALADEVDEAVHLVIPDGEDALYIDKIDGNKTIRMVSQIGRRAPMHASSVGKAILAFSDPHKVNQILKKGLQRYTSKTITSPNVLLAHLEEIRDLGYAVDDGENEEGIRCIGAPIFDYTGKVIGSVSVSGSTITVVPERVEYLAQKVMKCAEKISEKMGYHPQDRP